MQGSGVSLLRQLGEIVDRGITNSVPVMIPIILLALTILAGQSVAAQQITRAKAINAPEWGPNARLVEEYSIGDSQPEYTVRVISKVAADDSGSFYMYDDQGGQIRRYDARGVFERNIGRRGTGSGEYQGVSGLHVTRDGLLIVFDQASRRISYFQADGELTHEIAIGADYYASGFSVDADGQHYLTQRLPGPPEGPEARLQYVRISPVGNIVDSISHPRQILLPRTGFCLRTAEGWRCNFLRETLVAPWSKGGIITAQSTRYSFSLVSPGGSTLVVERAGRTVRLTKEERVEWLAWAAYMEARSLPGSRFEVPGTKPVIRKLFSDDLGRVWVEVYVAAEHQADSSPKASKASIDRPSLTWRERTTYDVFSPAGRFLGRLQLPPHSSVLSVRGDRAFLLSTTSNGYALVVCKIVVELGVEVGALSLGDVRPTGTR